MFRKLLLAAIAVIGLTATVAAKDTYAHDASVLPEAAKSVIDKNFKSNVSVVKIDKNFGRVSDYEVILQDGTEITFDSKGNWENVEVGGNKSVPSGFVPKTISDFVKNAQNGVRIVGIERDRKGYEVQVSNGVEMRFNKAGEFVRYDD